MTECTLGQCPHNKQCVTEIIRKPNDNTIYGNFMNFAKKKKITQQELEKIFQDLKRNGKCLTIKFFNKGYFKKVYTFSDNEQQQYVLLSETIESNNFEKSIKKIEKELSLQQKVWKSYPSLTPKVYTANIFQENEEIIVQTIMDNVIMDGYKELKDYPFYENLSLYTFAKDLPINKEAPFYNTITTLVKQIEELKQVFTNIEELKKVFTNIEELKKVFTNIDEVLEKWWETNCVLLSYIFIAIHKIHSLNILHKDLTNVNIFYREYSDNVFGIRIIDYGISCTVEEWCQEWKEEIQKGNLFIEESRKAYNGLDNSIYNRFFGLKKNSPEWLKAMMMAELTNFSKYNPSESNIYFPTYRFLEDALFKELPIVLTEIPVQYQTVKNICETEDEHEKYKKSFEEFNKQTIDVIKNFITKRYAEIITELKFKKK